MNKETIPNLMKQVTPYDDGVRKFLKVLYDITFFVLKL